MNAHEHRQIAPPPELVPKRKGSSLREPTAKELAAGFVGALREWFGAGLPVVSQAEYQARASTCEACLDAEGKPVWEVTAYGGIGKCRACGCTSLKRWLATSRCPLKKW